MPIVYLTPEDLTAAQAVQVLDFLNAVNSAEEIATRIEIEAELDVGLGVGQRILDFRRQLPEGFTSLQQLMDVPLVGPERFTEIVAVITGIPLPQFTPPRLEEMIGRLLARQLQASSSTLGPASEPYRIVVLPPAGVPWLGQEISLTLKVLSAPTQKPVANLPVTLESGTLALSTQFGYETRQGPLVTCPTATDGTVRLRLRHGFDELLTGDQQAALGDALRRLPSDTPAPRDMQHAWEELTAAYQDVRNNRLRSAIDIVYRSAARRLTGNINERDQLYQWQYQSDLLRIYLGAGSSPGDSLSPVLDATAEQTGIYHLRWREWLLPWRQVYLELLSRKNLQQTFADARQRIRSESGLTASILGHAYRFVAEQNGALGEDLGQRVIGREIQHFLAREINDVSAESKTSMFPSLLLASENISRSNTGTLSLVNQNRADVELLIDERIDGVNLATGEISHSLSQLNLQLEQLDGRLAQQDTRFGQLQTDLGKAQADISSFTSGLDGIRSDIDTLNADVARLDSSVLELSTDFQLVNRDLAGLQNGFRTLDDALGTLDTRVTTLNKDAVKVEDITRDSSGRLLDISRSRIDRG